MTEKKRYIISYWKIKQRWGRTVSKPLQYEHDKWVGMVLIRNLEIRCVRTDGQNDNPPYVTKKRMKYIYC
jgi:hypothetical protein